MGGLLTGIGRAAAVSALFLFALFFVPDPFVKQQVYGQSWYGKACIDATPKLYAKLSKLIKEAEQSSQAMNAHYRQEKDRMEQMMREPSRTQR